MGTIVYCVKLKDNPNTVTHCLHNVTKFEITSSTVGCKFLSIFYLLPLPNCDTNSSQNSDVYPCERIVPLDEIVYYTYHYSNK